MTQNKSYIVAVTGSIGTGKSTTTNYIKMRGYEVVDFDVISHHVIEEKHVLDKIKKSFEGRIFDGNILNKKKLASIVFEDKEKLNTLNEITHPYIYEKAKSTIDDLLEERIIFLDIPLLYETKNKFPDFYKIIDEVWVITSNQRVQTTRIMIRDRLTMDEASKKIKSQMSIRIKEKMGDVVIYNNSDMYSLYEDIRIELINLEKRVENGKNDKEIY